MWQHHKSHSATTNETNTSTIQVEPMSESNSTRNDQTSCCPVQLNDPISNAVAIVNANRVLKARIPIGNGKEVELIGRSWAADCTAFVVPSLDIALDAGYPVHGKRMSSVFITHTHTDHCHYMTHLKSRSKPPNVYLPSESASKMELFIDVAQQLTSNLTPEEYQTIPWETSYVLNGVQPGERIVVNKQRGLICDIVACDHGVPCVGFCFSQVKHSLKTEFAGLSGREIGALRKEGVAVTVEMVQPLFCFLGDTTTLILDGPEADKIFSCPTVIIECSFLTDDCQDKAARSKHVLWSDLKPHVVAHPQTTFVLTHFSHRWTIKEIREFFEEEDLPNVLPWIPSGEIGVYCRPTGGEETIDEIWSHF